MDMRFNERCNSPLNPKKNTDRQDIHMKTKATTLILAAIIAAGAFMATRQAIASATVGTTDCGNWVFSQGRWTKLEDCYPGPKGEDESERNTKDKVYAGGVCGTTAGIHSPCNKKLKDPSE